ncbi:hypothetical protein [Paenibacillus sp. NPDC058174]|uniref:hypothetical protein n=1 Tax=Paenibacillus sp. NPDC058174 TaxID=3346366 RepID=UPI0036DDA88D
MKLKMLVILLLILSLVACSSKSNTIEEAMIKANMEYSKINYIKELPIDKRALVFYENKELIGVGLLKKVNKGWEWVIGSSTSDDSKAEIQWAYSYVDESFPLVYGYIRNDEISKITLEFRVKKYDTNLIKVDNKTLFYALLDEPQNPPITIRGYNNKEEEVYNSDN